MQHSSNAINLNTHISIFKTHGGKRKNAGRKSKEPTKTIRVPQSLVPKITEMIKGHKTKPFHG